MNVIILVSRLVTGGSDTDLSDHIGTSIYFGIGALGFARASRMRVELSDDGLTVFKLFTTKFVSWSDLASVSADYHGMRLLRTDGVTVTAGSLGKSNWSKWDDRRVEADHRVDIVRERLLHARARSEVAGPRERS